jgi:hypothetical protein
MSTTVNGAGQSQMKLNEAPLITDLDLEALREFLQNSGYRAEAIKDGNVTFLRSATNGLPFDIRPGNSFAGPQNRFADIAFVALFAVRGTLPLDLVNGWNKSRRFGRLFLDQPVPGQEFLVFCLDVSVAGGVTPRQLRSQIELWDGLVQQLIPWLREELSKIAPAIDTAAASTNGSKQAVTPVPAEAATAEHV